MVPTPDGQSRKRTELKKIPSQVGSCGWFRSHAISLLIQVIADAKGLAIFTTMRSGLWISGAGGSGVLVARQLDGTWSRPSGIMLHTPDLLFLVGVDLYDGVVVINTDAALDVFTYPRWTLGEEIGAIPGPTAVDDTVTSDEGYGSPAPIWTYLKSRGYYCPLEMEGTAVIGRSDENERFYGERLDVAEILAGTARHPQREVNTLIQTIKAAQGDKNLDQRVLPREAAPGDVEFERPGHVFGVPDGDDPDPYGVRALEMEGLEIREAGTKSRPSSEQFEYRPAPTSPIYHTFHRRSVSSLSGRAREGGYGRRSMDHGPQTADLSTQTMDQPLKDLQEVEDERIPDDDARDETVADGVGGGIIDEEASRIQDHHHDGHATEVLPGDKAPNGHLDLEDHDVLDGSMEVHEEVRVQAAPQIISKARLVTIPKRIPPPPPLRSAARKKTSTDSVSPTDDHPRSQFSNAGTSTTFTASPIENGWSEVLLQSPSELYRRERETSPRAMSAG